MAMNTDKRVALTLGVGFLVLIGPLVLIVASNIGAGILSLILEIEPSRGEFIGKYIYSAKWGTAMLLVNADGTFKKLVTDASGPQRLYVGFWTSSKQDNSAKIDFRPFGMVWDEDHQSEEQIFGMNFYKRRFGKTYAKVNDDLGEQFEQQ